MKPLTYILKESLKDNTGAYSATRIWESLAYLTATFVVIWMTVVDKMGPEMLLIYLGALSARGGFNKYIEERWGQPK